MLHDEDFLVRIAAVWSLSNINNDFAVQPLLSALQDKRSVIKCLAIKSLSNFCYPQVIDNLWKTLISDSDPFVKMGSIRALQKLEIIEEQTEYYLHLLAQKNKENLQKLLAQNIIVEAFVPENKVIISVGVKKIMCGKHFVLHLGKKALVLKKINPNKGNIIFSFHGKNYIKVSINSK